MGNTSSESSDDEFAIERINPKYEKQRIELQPLSNFFNDIVLWHSTPQSTPPSTLLYHHIWLKHGQPELNPSITTRETILISSLSQTPPLPTLFIRWLLDHNTPLYSGTPLSSGPYSVIKTPIHAALDNNAPLETIMLLIKRGGDVEQCDNMKQTPLFKVISSGTYHIELIELILSTISDLEQSKLSTILSQSLPSSSLTLAPQTHSLTNDNITNTNSNTNNSLVRYINTQNIHHQSLIPRALQQGCQHIPLLKTLIFNGAYIDAPHLDFISQSTIVTRASPLGTCLGDLRLFSVANFLLSCGCKTITTLYHSIYTIQYYPLYTVYSHHNYSINHNTLYISSIMALRYYNGKNASYIRYLFTPELVSQGTPIDIHMALLGLPFVPMPPLATHGYDTKHHSSLTRSNNNKTASVSDMIKIKSIDMRLYLDTIHSPFLEQLEKEYDETRRILSIVSNDSNIDNNIHSHDQDNDDQDVMEDKPNRNEINRPLNSVLKTPPTSLSSKWKPITQDTIRAVYQAYIGSQVSATTLAHAINYGPRLWVNIPSQYNHNNTNERPSQPLYSLTQSYTSYMSLEWYITQYCLIPEYPTAEQFMKQLDSIEPLFIYLIENCPINQLDIAFMIRCGCDCISSSALSRACLRQIHPQSIQLLFFHTLKYKPDAIFIPYQYNINFISWLFLGGYGRDHPDLVMIILDALEQYASQSIDKSYQFDNAMSSYDDIYNAPPVWWAIMTHSHTDIIKRMLILTRNIQVLVKPPPDKIINKKTNFGFHTGWPTPIYQPYQAPSFFSSPTDPSDYNVPYTRNDPIYSLESKSISYLVFGAHIAYYFNKAKLSYVIQCIYETISLYYPHDDDDDNNNNYNTFILQAMGPPQATIIHFPDAYLHLVQTTLEPDNNGNNSDNSMTKN